MPFKGRLVILGGTAADHQLLQSAVIAAHTAGIALGQAFGDGGDVVKDQLIHFLTVHAAGDHGIGVFHRRQPLFQLIGLGIGHPGGIALKEDGQLLPLGDLVAVLHQIFSGAGFAGGRDHQLFPDEHSPGGDLVLHRYLQHIHRADLLGQVGGHLI